MKTRSPSASILSITVKWPFGVVRVIILCSVHTVSCRLHIQMERCAKFLSEDHEPHSGMPVVVQTNKQTNNNLYCALDTKSVNTLKGNNVKNREHSQKYM